MFRSCSEKLIFFPLFIVLFRPGCSNPTAWQAHNLTLHGVSSGHMRSGQPKACKATAGVQSDSLAGSPRSSVCFSVSVCIPGGTSDVAQL